MNKASQKSLLAAALALGLTFVAGPTLAHLCHNIGGPKDLGANCDGTGNCTYVFEETTITVSPGYFLGIKIPPLANPAADTRAQAAHIAHGDGPAVFEFPEPLHLASVIGPHRASNVECLGRRLLPQPPEPGN